MVMRPRMRSIWPRCVGCAGHADAEGLCGFRDGQAGLKQNREHGNRRERRASYSRAMAEGDQNFAQGNVRRHRNFVQASDTLLTAFVRASA